MTSNENFGKEFKLTSKKEIDDLFAKGKVCKINSLKLVYLITKKDNSPLKTIVSVPKKRFKKAVDRNLLKRRIREVIRKNKNYLFACNKSEEDQLHLCVIFINNTIIEYKYIEEDFIVGVSKMKKKIYNENDKK